MYIVRILDRDTLNRTI